MVMILHGKGRPQVDRINLGHFEQRNQVAECFHVFPSVFVIHGQKSSCSLLEEFGKFLTVDSSGNRQSQVSWTLSTL